MRTPKQNQAAAQLGALGGRARWRGKDPQDRSEEMRRVARARWQKKTPQ